MKETQSCCFTGHRNIDVNDLNIVGIGNFLVELVTKCSVTDFYAGGALGWDMLCEKIVLKIREIHPHIKLHLVLPCPPEIQTAEWNSRQKEEYYKILEAADDFEIVSEFYDKNCMKKRNARLVELADVCVCYYINSRSGTGQTVRMAKRKGLTVVNIAD